MQGWGAGWWKSSRVIGASSSGRCGHTLTPTLSQKERAIWTLLLPVQFGAVGHFAGFGNPGIVDSVALADGRSPSATISLIRFSAVVASEDGGHRWIRVRGSCFRCQSSSCRCGLIRHPNSLPKLRGRFGSFCCKVQFGAIGHLAGFGNPGLSRVALAVDKPQRYMFVSRLSAVFG